MRFRKLRILGFKSFVEPIEFVIEPGLTGVVGPNGCGKSNLVEALRWVMGENSYKNMRASGMDDVIFSGSGHRPARNSAEVTLFLGNEDRRAPAAFNDADMLEVSRRIERAAGSVYRINGREVRARDVQLLFADASTGARSPAMVRQGQIGELIAAKPTARRMILEEAAGISGLHSRRNEAEIRLRAAEQNLDRLEDVLREIDLRLDALRRQSRQAGRYRNLSADIRKHEALAAWLRWRAAVSAEADAAAAFDAAVLALADAQAAQGEAARAEAVAALHLPDLREAATASAAGLQRLRFALADAAAEAERVRVRLADLTRRGEEAARDLAREAALVAENDDRLGGLDAEIAAIRAASEGEGARRAAATAAHDAAATDLGLAEAALAAATGRHADAVARRAAAERAARDTTDRAARARQDLARADGEIAALDGRLAETDARVSARADLETAEQRLGTAEAAAAAAEAALEGAVRAERSARGPLAEAEREAGRLDTEARTLARILNVENGQLFPPLVDRLTAQRGYETALGVALGDDIEAPVDARAPAHWAMPGEPDGDAPLPEGAEPLGARVNGPPELVRRLAQIGLVAREDGPRLRLALKPGQSLVSREGDLWRWDGYLAAAEAPTPAAQRLAGRNRLAELDVQRREAQARLAERRRVLQEAQARQRGAAEAERVAREAVRTANRGLGDARDRLARAERAVAELASRRTALLESRARLAAASDEAATAERRAADALAAVPDVADLVAELQGQRMLVAEQRARVAEQRVAVEALAREAAERTRRLDQLVRDRDGWARRLADARAQTAVLAGRQQDITAERATLDSRPDEIAAERRRLESGIAAAERDARVAAEALAAGEKTAAEADRAAKAALQLLSDMRERRARAEERRESVAGRRAELEAAIAEQFEMQPAGLASLAELKPEAPLPDLAGIEQRLDRLRQERERLGGVNLQADDEATEVDARRTALIAERDDLVEAIRRLRGAIQSLNKEARERLLAAFGVVDGHFRRLFTHLFGGGTAELQLVDSEDPLEAGLEILARPPGKKPQTMTLLSGGEQALTAMALIFAVFLTNPAPICVLDEVDAPLDDANVERYCDLLDEMARQTETRFVVITHNPITMARMSRLFGVTMAERGVSQLVSVDLETAESFREAV
ncbi:chromosome segregation SMC family protein [Methylobrevis albus]|uniref:Chromosome partition protein Smc n=1 Tax=Methylobrevis albus TaxID=2793297 RepID=A0A931MY94_9HYPH|nr:AAA family ATPase [Methylobrevis albus]MBH0238162.1 AAA family ATPase [Methylobrevis albus]